MSRSFSRILTFRVDGEIYDTSTKAEDIIKNYNFNFRDYNDGIDKSFLEIDHKDSRGRIRNITRLPTIKKWKKPDSDLFVI
jgi:hypothetical protein